MEERHPIGLCRGRRSWFANATDPPFMRTPTSEAKAFEFIISLIYERTRIRLHDGKQHLIRSRLGKRMRLHGIESFEDYCHFLQNEAGEDEFTHVVDALTTNFTNFLREKDHFDFMVDKALPAVLPEGKRHFKIWSAASATGEEPYSIAFYLAEKFPPALGWDWRILATDISTRALARARSGIYPLERAQGVPGGWLKRYCLRGTGEYDGHFRIKPVIQEWIEFKHLNLLGPLTLSSPFELIFCRNVMIYFDRPTQEQLVNELAKWVVPGGYLLIGHSESLNGLRVPFKCDRPSVYRKL
jgi:chemotaxis protein methyltransferase CheR